jgi:hypothetical protein
MNFKSKSGESKHRMLSEAIVTASDFHSVPRSSLIKSCMSFGKVKRVKDTPKSGPKLSVPTDGTKSANLWEN